MRPALSVVSSELPEPPYPRTTKANGYRPEVDWQRIRGSKTWRLCPPEMRNNLLRLWLESWNEVPAGSWDNDPEIIASAIDMPHRLFVAHRDQLLRGWALHSDGRLYHETVTEMVLAMLSKRRSSAERVAKHREKKQQVTADVTCYQHVSNAQEQEQEQDIPPNPQRGDGESEVKKPRKPRETFVRPDPTEVQAYCDERRNGIVGETFCAFYESKGWRVGTSPMRDWKAAVRTWEAKRKEQAQAQASQPQQNRGKRV